MDEERSTMQEFLEQMESLHGGHGLKGDAGKFARDGLAEVENRSLKLEPRERRKTKREMEQDRKSMLEKLYSLDERMVVAMDDRYREATGREETLFGHMLDALEEPLYIPGRPSAKDDELFWLGIFCRWWGVPINPSVGSLFRELFDCLMGELKNQNWDRYISGELKIGRDGSKAAKRLEAVLPSNIKIPFGGIGPPINKTPICGKHVKSVSPANTINLNSVRFSHA